MGLSHGTGPTTNGEARTMAAITTGIEPQACRAFVVITAQDNGTIWVVTDECAVHATAMLVQGINHLVMESETYPEGTDHDWP